MMKLGILYQNGIIVNHRSLLKVLVNPILRKLGYQIGTVCHDNQLQGIKLVKCQKSDRIIWDFKSYNDHDTVVKKRLLI